MRPDHITRAVSSILPHDFDQHTVQQEYLPVDKQYYRPTDQGYEDTIAKRMGWSRNSKKGRRRDR